MSPDTLLIGEDLIPQLPDIEQDDPFVKVVKKLSFYVVDAIDIPRTSEQLRTTSGGNKIQALVEHLVANVTNPAIVNALLTLKWHFSCLDPDDRGLNETRANACEIIAWRFLSRLSERDAIDFALYELPDPDDIESNDDDASENGASTRVITEDVANEQTRLLTSPTIRDRPTSRDSRFHQPLRTKNKRQDLIKSVASIGRQIYTEDSDDGDEEEEDPTSSFTGMNALEIAAVADAKKFLSQPVVQKIVNGIWTGEIVFWDSLSVHTTKKAQLYNKHKADPYTRLRVPRYIKAFEVLFFVTFLVLYYAVTVDRNPYDFTVLEMFLYLWIAAFAYDELTEFIDAGSLFYTVDFWNLWDLAIIVVGFAFLVTRVVGMLKDSDPIVDASFDILSLEALFLVPRIFSLLSLQPYFGTLIPCLKQMTKDFIKFMSVVAILYLGFLTTFTVLARDTLTLSQMSWILVKVFFGSSYLGFEIMYNINPILGPPLMIVFVCMTNILLITSLISILGDSWGKVVAQSREEYLYVYSIYVLEASTSNRLTHFFPPLNLIPLIFLRPLRIFLSSEQLRQIRIVVLKATHTPIIAAIKFYESIDDHLQGRNAVAPLRTMSDGSFKRQRPFLTDRTTSKTASQFHLPPHRSPIVSAESSPIKAPSTSLWKRLRKDAPPPVATGSKAVDMSALEKQVADLNAKIEELTALILADKQGSPPKTP